MEKWLKYGLWAGVVATVIFILLGGFSLQEGNIVAAFVFLPIFPLFLIIAFLGDSFEKSANASLSLPTIASTLVFLGYFIWGAIIGKISSGNAVNIRKIIMITFFIILGFIITLKLLMSNTGARGIRAM